MSPRLKTGFASDISNRDSSADPWDVPQHPLELGFWFRESVPSYSNLFVWGDADLPSSISNLRFCPESNQIKPSQGGEEGFEI